MTMPSPSARKVFVVGAGLCGLSAAWRLQQAGCAVEVFERETRVSGRVKSVQLADSTIDTGATVFLPAYREARALIEELGLTPELQDIRGSVVFPREGRLYQLDLQSPWKALFTPIIGWRSKLSLVKLLLRFLRVRDKLNFLSLAAARGQDKETLAEYCRRRFAPEVYCYLLNPAIKFLYIHNGESGSLIELLWWMRANGLGRPQSLRRGTSSLTDALAARLSVHASSEVTQVVRRGDGVALTVRQADGSEQTRHADACIVTVPAPVAARICTDGLSDRQRRILSERRYEPCIVVSFCTRRRPALDALMFMLPDEFDADLATVIFAHNIGPQRAPSTQGVVNAYFMARWSREQAQASDEEVMVAARARLLPWIAELDELVDWNVQRWPYTAAIAEPGDCGKMQTFEDEVDPQAAIQVIGDFQAQASMNVAVAVANRAAQRLIKRLGLADKARSLR